MKTLVTLLILLAFVVFAGTAEAQKAGRFKKNKNTYKKASDKANKAAAKRAQSAAKKAARKGDSGDDSDDGGIIKGLPEADSDEDDATQKPGEPTSTKAKGDWIEKEMDKLGVKKKAERAKMKRVGVDALKASEKEDKRYSDKLKKLGDDSKLKASAKLEHKKKLGEIWEKADKELKKREILDEEKFEEWKKDTAEKRTKTATDYWEEEQSKKAARSRKGKRRKKNDSED